MRWQRSAAPRIPPCSANEKWVFSGAAGGSAGSRRFVVSGAASTMTPGLKRPSGSNSALTLRIAS